MPPSYIYPDDYEIFRVGKMLRRKAAYNAYERHGFVWYVPLEGVDLAHERCRKTVEETAEVIAAHSEWQFDAGNAKLRAELINELGDLSDVMDALRQHVAGEFTGIQTAGNMNMVLPRWREWEAIFAEGRDADIVWGNLAEAISYTRNSVSRYLKQWSITPQELAEARQKKNTDKGPLLPGRVEYLALPRTDEWIPHFREKFESVLASQVSPPPPAHPHLTAVTPG